MPHLLHNMSCTLCSLVFLANEWEAKMKGHGEVLRTSIDLFSLCIVFPVVFH